MSQRTQNRADKSEAKRPANPLAYAHARLREAQKLRRAGELSKAISICEALIDEFPDYVGALQTLGLIHIARQSHWQALSCFVRCAMLVPDEWTILTNLAGVYSALGANEMAAQTLRRVLEIAPDDAEVHFVLGEVYREEREYERAAEAYRRALALSADHLGAAHGLGQCCAHMGRIEEAAEALRKVVLADPTQIKSLYSLTQLPASLVKFDVRSAVARLRRNESMGQEEFEADVEFVKAAMFDRMGRYDEAWKHLLEANRRVNILHEDEHRSRFQYAPEALAEARAYSPERFPPAAGPGQPISLFVIGPSRSGKTTAEGLLGNLPGVKRGYESRIVENAVRRAHQVAGLLSRGNLADMPKGLEGPFREFYSANLNRAAGGAKVFTSTHPAMIDDVGRLFDLVPGARFVFVRRDRYDLALRILMKKYQSGNHYAYNLRNTLEYIDWYHDMIDLWREKLPEVTLELAYEEIVVSPADSLLKAAALCGLSVPAELELPKPGDDRGCSLPYRSFMQSELETS